MNRWHGRWSQTFARLAPMATSFNLWVHIRADRPLSAGDVSAATMAVGPRAAVTEIQRVPDMVSAATRQPVFRMSLLLWFCGLSLLLAAIGIYGLVTQAVTERMREIAVRIALGAHPREVIAGFVRSALISGAIGLAIGVTLATMLARTIESQLYGTRTGDAVSPTMAAAVLLVVVGVAAWVPARRIARVDATKVLRA